jgi:AraC-like DNA-binding protein
MSFLPAAAARALLAGMRAAGLDAEAVRVAAALAPADLEPVDGVLPLEVFPRLWEAAFRQAPREELPAEVGLAVPFGSFGALDYLAASSPDVEAAFHALASHFRYVAAGFGLEVEAGPEGGEVRLVPAGRIAAGDRAHEVSDEFTLAVLVGRFTENCPAPFATEVRLTRSAPAHPTRHERLFGAPVIFGCALAALRVHPASWKAPMGTADPMLQETLRRLAERLQLGGASTDLELAIRARLRTMLPEGRGVAGQVARSLGMSERTLHRRLRDIGRTFQEVLDGFRESETERLLVSGGPALSELALRLGFSDQSAWNRAFRRWKGTSPTEWAASRGRR